MKTRLALIAGLLAFGSPVFAQDALFSVTTSQPGSMQFNGTGTATYNNSLGTGNSINLGSSSSLGVSNSVSATGDYHGSSSSYVQLQDTTAFQQTIGTSSMAANTQATAQAAETSASSTAESVADKTVTSQLGYSYDNYLDKYNAAEANTATQGDVAGTTNSAGSTAAYSESQWGEATSQLREESFNAAYSEAYSAVSASSQTTGSSESASGVVSGTFNTTNSGSAANSSQVDDFTSTATAVANGTYGDSFVATQDASGAAATGTSATHDSNGFTETEYEDKWSEAFSGSMSSSISSAQTQSQSTSEVKGIGNIANVTTSGDSNFAVDLAARAPADISPENGSANGSASASLSTNSSVSVNNTQFSSAFIQAFAPE
jgi:hypothetical protein